MAHHETLAQHDHHDRLDRPPLEINVRHGMNEVITSHNDHQQLHQYQHNNNNGYPINNRSVPVKQIIDGINHAVTQSQRHHALHIASQAFHHNDTQMHNYEYDSGAIHALCLKLGYVLLQKKNTTNNSHHSSRETTATLYGEITTLCHTLKTVLYGCSSDRQEHSFYDIGQSELIPLLIQILAGHHDNFTSTTTMDSNVNVQDSINNNNNGGGNDDDDEQRYEIIEKSQTDAIYRTIQLLRVFSKLDLAKQYMIHANEKCLLRYIVEICSSTTRSTTEQVSLSLKEIRLEGLALIKDLSFRSSEQDKTHILGVDGLVRMITNQCLSLSTHHNLQQQQYNKTINTKNNNNREQEACHIKGKEYVSAILWNLALSRKASYQMSASFDILKVLILLMTAATTSTATDGGGTGTITASANTTKTRRNATSALGNLATIPDNLHHLLTYNNGEIILALIQATEKDIDTDCRRRAMRTLRCLTNGTATAATGTITTASATPVQLILQKAENFVNFLLHKIQNDSDLVTKIQACETLGHVARQVVVPIEVLTTLSHIVETASEDKFALVAFRTLTICIQHTTSETPPQPKRISGIATTTSSSPSPSQPNFSQNFFQALERLVRENKDQEAQICFSQFFSILMNNDEKCRSTATTVKRLLTCCESVLNSLSTLLTMDGPDFEESRLNALQVVINLVETEENMRPMAEHDALLTALVNVALASPTGNTKDEAKTIILKLVPQL